MEYLIPLLIGGGAVWFCQWAGERRLSLEDILHFIRHAKIEVTPPTVCLQKQRPSHLIDVNAHPYNPDTDPTTPASKRPVQLHHLDMQRRGGQSVMWTGNEQMRRKA